MEIHGGMIGVFFGFPEIVIVKSKGEIASGIAEILPEGIHEEFIWEFMEDL